MLLWLSWYFSFSSEIRQRSTTAQLYLAVNHSVHFNLGCKLILDSLTRLFIRVFYTLVSVFVFLPFVVVCRRSDLLDGKWSAEKCELVLPNKLYLPFGCFDFLTGHKLPVHVTHWDKMRHLDLPLQLIMSMQSTKMFQCVSLNHLEPLESIHPYIHFLQFILCHDGEKRLSEWIQTSISSATSSSLSRRSLGIPCNSNETPWGGKGHNSIKNMCRLDEKACAISDSVSRSIAQHTLHVCSVYVWIKLIFCGMFFFFFLE